MLRPAGYARWILSLAVLSLAVSSCRGGAENEETPTAEANIVKYKAVRILTAAVNPPFEFGLGTSVQGYDVDLGNEISRDLGYEAKWVKASYDRLVDILVNGEVELVISAFAVETPVPPDMKKRIAFSEPYFTSYDTIARRKDRPDIRDLASLAGKRVGVMAGTTAEAFMKSQTVARNVALTTFGTPDDGLGALNLTQIDAMVGDGVVLTYSITQTYQNLIPLEDHLTEKHFAVVTRAVEKELIGKVNATIGRMKAGGQLEKLRVQWLKDVMDQAARQRKELLEEEELRRSPKTVVVNMVQTAGANFQMDRLDGFQAELVGSAGTFKSNPILTEGRRGSCRFPRPVPPGKYRFRMSILSLNEEVVIPEVASRTVSIDMTMGSGISITVK